MNVEIANDVQSILTANEKKLKEIKTQEIEKILGEFIEKAGPIDFRKKYDIPKDRAVQKTHYVLAVSDQIVEIAKREKLNLVNNEGIAYIFDGICWRPLPKERFKLFIRQISLSMKIAKAVCIPYRFREEVYKQFCADAQLPSPDKKERQTLINLMNGTLEVSATGFSLRQYNEKDFLTYVLPFSYDETAEAKKWKSFLNDVLPDLQLQNVLAELVASVFSDINLEKIGVLYGSGANGKSVVGKVITAVLGSENVTNFTFSSLTDEKSYTRAEIRNKLLNFSTETSLDINAPNAKLLASREPVGAREIYGKPFIMTRYARLMFNANVLPQTKENTDAYFRRFLIIPFERRIPEEKQILDLHQQIIDDELPGVLNWILEGLLRLMNNGRLSDCQKLHQAQAEFRNNSDSIASFVEDMEIDPGAECYITFTILYKEYIKHCRAMNLHPSAKNEFSRRMKEMNFQISRFHGVTTVFYQRMNGEKKECLLGDANDASNAKSLSQMLQGGKSTNNRKH